MISLRVIMDTGRNLSVWIPLRLGVSNPDSSSSYDSKRGDILYRKRSRKLGSEYRHKEHFCIVLSDLENELTEYSSMYDTGT